MKEYLLIGLGSAFGGIARHWLTTVIALRSTSAFPLGTFVVNVVGSALIGFIFASDTRINPATKQFLTAGVMGGFTTFSAFSLQTVTLFQSGKIGVAITYVVASLAICVIGCWIGWWAAQQF